MDQNRGLRQWRPAADRRKARQPQLLPKADSATTITTRVLQKNPSRIQPRQSASKTITRALNNPVLTARRLAQSNDTQAIQTLIRVMLIGARLPGFNPPTQIHGLIPRYQELRQLGGGDPLLVCCFQEQQDTLRQLIRIYIEAGGKTEPLFFKTVEEWIEKKVPVNRPNSSS